MKRVRYRVTDFLVETLSTTCDFAVLYSKVLKGAVGPL